MSESKHKLFDCDLCGSSKAVEVPYARLHTGDQPIHICTGCGFVYVRARRSSDEIARAWSEDLYGSGYTARIPAVVTRQTYVAEFIDTKIGLKGKDLCDIGTGEGQFLEIARRQYGAKIFGTEASKSNCQKLEKADIPNFCGTIEAFSASSKAKDYHADIATIMWTMENCMSCNDMLAGAHDVLRDDGHVVIATGSRILVPFKKPLSSYFSTNPTDTHSFRFSANTLRGILAVCGFETVHINSYIDTDYLVVIAKKRPKGTQISWQGDDWMKVHNFFERWHHESIHYSEFKNAWGKSAISR